MLTSNSGAARQWQVPIAAGEGSANLSHTVAEDIHLQLAGSDYSSFVDMGSLNVTFLPGVATRYVFATSVLHGTVDWPVRVRVEARDQHDNLATGEQRSLWIAFNTSVVQVVDFANGVGTALVSSMRPGPVEVTLRDPVHTSADVSNTMIVHFAVGVVYRYAFVTPAVSSFVAGTMVVISLAAEDQFGNLVEAESRSVRVLTSRGSGGGTVSFTNGRSSTSVTHTVAELVVLSLSDVSGTGLDVSSTLTVRYIGGPAHTVSLAATPDIGTVDSPLGVALTALDRYLNLAASATEAVQVVATGTLVSGGGSVSFVGGRASAYIRSQRVQTVQVSLLDLGAGLDVSATLSLNFMPGAPRSFALEAPASGTAGTPVTVVVKALDQYGNPATSAQQSVTVQASGAGQLSNGGVVSLTSGLASVLLAGPRAERVEVTLQDTFLTGLSVTSRATVDFGAAPATRYVLGFATAQTSSSVDSTVSISVTALDQYGNTATGEQRGVGLRTNASAAASPTPVAISNGVGTASIGHTVPEMLTVYLVDTQSTALDVSSTLVVRFTAGQARSLAFQPGLPTSSSVDATFPVTVLALDQYGNIATGSSNIDVEVRLAGTQVTGAGRLTLVQGRGTTSVTSQRPQSVPITFADTYGTGLDVSAQFAVGFTTGAPSKVAMTVAAASAVVGSSVSATLNILDQYGNQVATGSASISVVVSGSASLSMNGLAQLQNGVGSVVVQNTKAETVTLTMQDSFSSGLDVSDSQSLAFRAGPAARYSFVSSRLQGSVDTPVQVDVQAFDQFGNLASDQNADVGFSSSAGGAATIVDISAGRGSSQVRHTVAEALTLTLVDSRSTGLDVSTDGSLEVTFAASSAQRIALQASVVTSTVDSPLQVTVRALDRHGNLATTENRAVEVRKGGVTSLGRVDLASGEGLVSVPSTTVGSVTVTPHDTYGTSLDCSGTIALTFTGGAASRLVLSPQSGSVGDLVNLTVNALDQYGNEASPTSVSVTVRASGSAAVFNNGIVALSQSSIGAVFVRNTKAETVTLSMEDSFSTNLDVSDTKTMVFLAGSATRYAFTSVPSQASVDTTAQISIHALDQYDNVATTQQADVGVQLSGSASTSIVDIAAGRGTLQVARTAPQVVSMLLVDSQGTGLSVAGGSANVTFIPGAARSLAFQPGTVTGTVDAPVMVELHALDQYGNLATTEGRAVEARTSSPRVSGLGRVDLAQGRGSLSVASELAQSVQVTLQDTYSTGMDCTASGTAVFGHGELRSFRLADSAGASRVVAKVGRTVTVHTRAEDQYGNLVTNLSSVAIAGAIQPAPTNGSNASLTWSVSSGVGTQDIYILSAGVFSVRVVDASGQAAQAGLLSAAADRSVPWYLEFRYDLVPPDYAGLNISSITQTEVVINVNGLTEPSTVWCIAADAASNPPLTPGSISDGEVYAALRGSGNVTSTPAARAGPFVSVGQLALTGLEAGRTYAIRCAAADEDGNQMTGQRILEHQLAAATPQNPAPPPQAEEEGTSVLFILGIVGICVASLIFCCAAAYFVRARSLMKKLSGIVPAWGGGDKETGVVPQPSANGGGQAEPGGAPDQRPRGSGGSAPGVDKSAAAALAGEIDKSQGQDLSPSIYGVEEPTPKFGVDRSPVSLEEAETDDEEGGGHDDELLRDALAMQQELMDELQKRGDLEDDHDSTESDDSDTEAIVRDVKAFLRNQMVENEGGANANEPALVLPDLPLLLSSEDEARLSALIALGQQDGASWAKRLANFDELWKDVKGPAWLEAREVVRAEMQERQNQIEATRKQLQEAKEAVERHSEASETAILDALASEEEAVASEADERLKALHQLAIDWPEEDATQRNAVITEWAPKITAADHLPKAERAQIRKEAIEVLRKLDDQREAALEAELENFEAASTGRFEALQEGRAEAWRKMCEGSAQQAAKLREEVARLRLQVAAMGRQAEEAALQAALRLRRRLRDDAIEAEMNKEAEDRERQLAQWRAKIQELLVGDSEETVAQRERALAMLERAGSHAKKVASDEHARRIRHWHEILEERSRDRLKAMRKRFQDEEKRLVDEAAEAQEEATEAESRRRVVLVLGALHRTEAATLAVSSSARRGRILMGLQATAAGSVAEERLPRRESSDRHGGQVSRVQSEAFGTTGMGVTGLRWQDAQRKAAEELNAALDQVAEILSEHGQRQRALLAQRQRREASLASAPEGDDERREDLLDALEENMRREIRGARWQHHGQAAEASAHRGAGEESELGRRLAAVNRDSQLLSTEDEIGEHYDRLRALVMGPGAEEEYAAQRQAQALEREAAALRAEAMVDMDLADSPQTAWAGETSKADLQAMPAATTESRVEAMSEPDEERERRLKKERTLRQRSRQEALQRARALIKEGQLHEAMEVLRASLEEETAFEDATMPKSADALALTVRSVSGSDWVDQKDAAHGGAQDELAQSRARRLDAIAQADVLESSFRTQEALQVLLNALQEAGEPDKVHYASQRSVHLTDEDRLKLLQSLTEGQGKAAELVALAGKEQRARLDARQRRRQEVLQKAKELEAQGQTREAAQAVIAEISAERAEELREETGEVPAALDWKMLQADLAARGQMIEGAADQDAEARRAKLAAQREARRKHREEQLEKAKKLQSHGYAEQALEVAIATLDEKAQEDAEDEQAMIEVARQSIEESSLSEEERVLFMSALSTSQEAIEREKEAQRQKLEARRKARRQRREDLQLQAQELAREGKHREAAELISEAMASDEAAAEVAESDAGLDADIDWSSLKNDLSKRQDRQSTDMAKDAEARKLKLQRLREERKRRREEATKMSRELEAQGLEKEALEVMVDALKEDEEVSDGEHEVRQAPLRAKPAGISDAERASILDTFAEGEAERDKAVASGAEEQRQKVEERRRARQQKREEAERRAEELERQAAEVRAAGAEKAKAVRGAAAGTETTDKPDKPAKAEFDAVSEWQEAARRRAAVGVVASFCQKGQESAARRLLDTAESAAERGALKDAFASEMEKCGAAVADEREVQRRRARERLDERRKKREAAAQRAQEPNRSQSFGTGLTKMRKVVQHQFHGVHGLKKIHSRRRQRIVEEHREVERKVRDEMEREMEALRQQLHHEAEIEIRRLQTSAPSPAPPAEPLSEDDAKKEREAGMARATEVKDLIQTERQRQAERIEARLAQRRNKLRKREAAVVQSHQWVEARVELDQERERLQAKPVSKAKNKQLMKELHKVNNIIANLQHGGPGSGPQSPSRTGPSPSPGSPLQGAGARLVDVDGEMEGSEEEV